MLQNRLEGIGKIMTFEKEMNPNAAGKDFG